MRKTATRRTSATPMILLSLLLCMAASGCSAGEPTAGALDGETTNAEPSQGETKNARISQGEETTYGEETMMGSEAACAQSRPGVEPSQAVPGETFRLYGQGFRNGCNDTRSPGVEPPPEPPERNIRVEMRQGEKVWDLGRVDANDAYVLDAYLEVPLDAEPGEAVVVTHTVSASPIETPLLVLAG